MTSEKMSPVFISPGQRKIVVFGGGKVALRKCRHFDGFDITSVADDFLPEMCEITKTVNKHIDEDCVKEMSKNAWLIIAATDNKELNCMIRDICLKDGIQVNSAHGGGDVLIPSVLKKDGYTVTVSTGGKAPAFPPYVVKQIDTCLDESYGLMLELLLKLRPITMSSIPTQPERAAFLASVLDDKEIWKQLEDKKLDSAYNMAIEKGGLQ